MALLDSSAVLAFLQNEVGADRVEPYLDGAALLSINLAEVVGEMTRRGLDRRQVASVLAPLALSIEPFTEDMAWLAGERRSHLPSKLGIADACCLAAAAVRGMPAITTDAAWREAAAVFGADVIVVR